MASVTAQTTNAQKALQLPTEYAVGTNPQSIAQADFNQDGIMDLAVGAQDGSVTILLGQSNGTFTSLPAFSAASAPADLLLTTADFNGDGKPDLIVANGGVNSTSFEIFYGNGDGTFSASSLSFPLVPGTALQIAVGDLNGDGVPDIVVAANSVTLLLSTATGYAASNLPSDPTPTSVAVADVNQDGKLDVVVAAPTTNRVIVYLGRGNGGFDGYLVSAGYHYLSCVVVADFNGDGKPDIAVADAQGASFSVLLGNGDGTFGSPINISTSPNSPYLLTAGDFNGDGKVDLTVSEFTSTGTAYMLQVFTGKGDGTFSTPGLVYLTSSSVPTESASTALAGDYNHDGKLDLALPNVGANTISIVSGNGDGTLQAATWLPGGTEPNALVLADVNSDGKPDLIIGTIAGFAVQLGNGDGTFQTAITNTSATYATFLAVGDFNADKKMDLAVASATADYVATFTGNNDGTFSVSSATYPPSGSPANLVVADFNGDGYADIMLNATVALDLYLFNPQNQNFPGTPSATLNPNAYISSFGSNLMAVGDFNHDGIPDVAIPVSCSPITCLAVEFGRSPSYFGLHNDFLPLGQAGNQAVVGDFNGDGNPDVAVAGSGYITVFLGAGDGTFPIQNTYYVSGGANYIAVGDFNGDGKLDIAVTGTNTVSVFLGNGDGTLPSTPQTFTIPGANYLVASDINGDGLTDLAVMDSSGNGVSLLLGNGAVVKLTSSVNSAEFDQPASFTATVTAAVASEGTPTGSVSFYADGSLLSSAPLSGKTASTSDATLAPGNHTITAVYSGDSNFPTAHGSLTETVIKAPTSVTLTPSANPVKPTQAVTITATIVPGTSGTPTGTVTFFNGATSLGSVSVNGAGQAPITTSSLALGSDTITAQYSGDADYTASNSAPLTESVSGGVANVAPASLNFGNVGLNKEGEPLYATLTNAGNLPLNIASVLSNSIEFIVSSNCPSSLAVNASCTITVRFKPKATGLRDSTLTVTDDYASGSQTVSLTGTSTSTIVNLSTTSEVFSSELIGNSSAAKTITLTNTSTTTALTISSITYSGDFPVATVSNACPNSGTLAAGAQCSLGVIFTPTAPGNRTGSITIVDSDSTGSQVVGLSGVATALQITPASLNFGTDFIGITTPTKQVLLANLSNVPISLTGISTSAGFAVASNSTCGTTLAANGACTIDVTFSPTAAGTQSGSLTIISSDPASPSTVKLTGVGTSVQLTPTALNFGSEGMGTTSASQSTLLTNLGTVALNISSIQITGADPTDFAIQPSTTCVPGTPVPAVTGNTCSITVAFQPTAAGARSATLTISDNGGGGSQTVSLKGTGVATIVSITVTPANPSLATGNTLQFTATATYSDSSTKDLTSTVTWSSSSIGVATISNAAGTKGQAHGIAAGSTNIVATSGAVSGVTALTVTP